LSRAGAGPDGGVAEVAVWLGWLGTRLLSEGSRMRKSLGAFWLLVG